ncbi:hypothetical protein LIA77_07670 [Sarocladium implicatum]|nr:hypothetical protein LIA77_07670 [Sarocladium implicatum]
MPSQQQLTLWLWMEGAFPRRIVYFLLMKKLTPTVSSLLSGSSTDPNLKIVPLNRAMPPLVWETVRAEDPAPPENARSPCLRITDPATGSERFIYESTSILLYLEELYPENSLQPSDPVDRAKVTDFLTQINLVATDTNYKLRNTIPEHGMMMGLMPENQRQETADNAAAQETKGFKQLLNWAQQETFQKTGWLTPGMDGPGLVDLTLVADVRFVELAYGIETFRGEELEPLRRWYEKFQTLDWWPAFEEREGSLPAIMSFGKTSRAKWVTEGEH